MTSNLEKIIREEFPQKTVLVVGDLVADQFLHGTITRVSREAPVFILRHDRTLTLPGAAANAAANVAALGGKARAVGVVGNDENGAALIESLKLAGVDSSDVISADEVRTTTKIRVLAGQEHAARQQVIRIDYETPSPLSEEIKTRLNEVITAAAGSADAIIISDYNYGVASQDIARTVSGIAKEKNIPVIVDSRFCLGDFTGVTSATPNQDEIEQIAGRRITNVGELEKFCSAFLDTLGYLSLMVTRGSNGLMLLEKDSAAVHLAAIGSKEPVDVTGAGDTVIAAYALGLASGLSFVDAARVANHAGGIVVMKRGTATASADELLASLSTESQSSSANS
jgi:rfaE bifunctional protein kinase chain/domain